MSTITTQNLRRVDAPQGNFNWSTFSNFALTFDPLSQAINEADQMPARATPIEAWTVVALRYYLYCWQRISSNQGRLLQEAVEKVQVALKLLRMKL